MDGSVYIRTTGNGRRAVYYLDEISRKWRHPWFVTGFYEDGSWKIQIKPGFVNGEAAMAGSDEVDEDGRNKVLPLTDYPKIPLRKDIFEQPQKAPEYFKRLGVKDPPKPEVNAGGPVLSITLAAEEEESPTDRMLLQCVMFLSQARATQKMVADIPGNLLTANLVEYTVTWDTSSLNALGRRARINVAKQIPTAPAPDFMDLLSGTIQDDSIDHLQMATLYFLSPPGLTDANPSEGPGASWQLYVKHDVFWNMDYSNKNKPPINIPGFALDAATAFFVGRYTFAPAATLGATNALLSRALAAAFNGASNRGRFWTV